MYTFGEEFTRALERRMAWDVVGAGLPSRRRLHDQMYAELQAVVSGSVEQPTELQQRLREQFDDLERQYEVLMKAALASPVDEAEIQAAASELLAGILGRAVSLELRLSLLETVVDSQHAARG